MDIPDTALGAVIAAAVTGIVTLLGLIISKENKTSEFRQAWIDALRSNLASVIGHVNIIEGTLRVHGSSGSEGWKEARNDVRDLNSCIASIKLRVNPDEADSRDLLTTLDDLERILAPGKPVLAEQVLLFDKRIIEVSTKILKTEWLRVRNGEAVFQAAKIISFVVLLLAIATFVLTILA